MNDMCRLSLSILCFFVVPLFLVTPTMAHQDRVIRISEGGALRDLPEKYQPAVFDYKARTFQVGKNKIKLPRCIFELSQNKTVFSLRITSSWYHKGGLPAYININFAADLPIHRDRFSLLFKLNTLELIEEEIFENDFGQKCLDQIERVSSS